MDEAEEKQKDEYIKKLEIAVQQLQAHIQNSSPAYVPQQKTMPRTDLELNLLLTDTVWNDTTNGRLVNFSRDLRLGNLNGKEFDSVVSDLILASDLLQEGMEHSAVLGLSRVATHTELSQSRNGFVRRRMGTLTSENVNNDEPEKRSFFGKKVGNQ